MGSRSTIARFCTCAAVVAALVGPAARTAAAQTESELRAARELFQDAYRDEQDRRYPEALEKFQRVAKVKETGAVRYRIASVLADMGRLREARDIFRALARGSTPGDTEIAESAAEEAAELDRKIPKLSLRVEAPPSDGRITIDGAPVPVASSTFELDPGDHVVAATSGARIVHEEKLHVGEGREVRHTIAFASTGSDRTLGIAAVATGGALVVTSAVLLALRESAIRDIESTCPNDVCPTASRSAVTHDRDRAELFRPLGLGLGLGGLVVVGVGAYLLVRHPSSPATASLVTRLASGSFVF